MKKKILTTAALFVLFFSVSGFYVLSLIDATDSKLKRITQFHRVDMLMETLHNQIDQMVYDFHLLRTPHARNAEIIRKDREAIQATFSTCSECHHAQQVREQIDGIRQDAERYYRVLDRIMALRAANVSAGPEEESAFRLGWNTRARTGDLVTVGHAKMAERSGEILRETRTARYLMFALAGVGTFLTAVLAVLLTRGLTRPITELLGATQRLTSGDLDHRIRPLPDEFGRLAASFNEMAAALDIQIEKVAASERRASLLFTNAGDAIFFLQADGDERGRIVAANGAAAAMHGYTVSELMAMNIRDIDAPEDAALVEARFGRIFRGEWIKEEVRHRRKDGSFFPVEISAGLLEHENRRFVLAIDRDITDRKRAEEAIRSAQRVKLAGEMATGLAHEIKNPLAGIKVTMEALAAESYLPADDRVVLLKVVDQIVRIETLLKAILNFARPPRPQKAPANMNAIIESAAAFSLQGANGSAGRISVVRELDARCPTIMADPMQMQQVFMNLLLNAVDAMPSGGTVTVRTACDPRRGTIRAEVEDTGTGIVPEAAGHIFEPFFTTKAKGAGLGLAVTKRLVEEHGGTITAENRPEGGARITIELPAGTACAEETACSGETA